MKLSIIIKRYLKNDLLKPYNFYYIDENIIKEKCPNIIKRTFVFMIFLFICTFFLIFYYFSVPFSIINEWCESWCEM